MPQDCQGKCTGFAMLKRSKMIMERNVMIKLRFMAGLVKARPLAWFREWRGGRQFGNALGIDQTKIKALFTLNYLKRVPVVF